MSQWFYSESGVRKGPVSLEAVKAAYRSGEISDTSLVWKSGMDDWQSLAENTELYRQCNNGGVDEPPPSREENPSRLDNSTESMKMNPYAAPQVEFVENGIADNYMNSLLASRWARLGASMIDSIILILIIIPIAFFFLSTTPSLPFWSSLAEMNEWYTTIGFLIVYFAVNSSFLIKRGQTLGKMAVGIKIVDAETGEIPNFARTGLLRYGASYIIGQLIPLFGLVDILFIFGKEKRCVHDLMANTKVVNS